MRANCAFVYDQLEVFQLHLYKACFRASLVLQSTILGHLDPIIYSIFSLSLIGRLHPLILSRRVIHQLTGNIVYDQGTKYQLFHYRFHYFQVTRGP